MKKVNQTHISIAYATSKKYFHKEIDRKKAIAEMVMHGISEGYSGIFLHIFEHLKNGSEFRRTTSGDAFEYFLKTIREDYGQEQLKLSLEAFKKHITYFEAKYNINRPLFWNIYKKFKNTI